MKRNTRFIVGILTAALFSLGFGSQALAWGGKHHKGQNVDKRVEKMTEHLDLTDTQADEVRTILEAKRASFKALKADESLDRDAKRSQMHALKKSTHNQLATVLNDDQQAKMKAMKKKYKKGKKGKRGKRGKMHRAFSERNFDKTAAHLELSEPQQKSIRSILENAKLEREAIVDASDGDRRAARPELKNHRQQVKSKIEGVLSAEQVEKLQSLKKDKKMRGHKRGKK